MEVNVKSKECYKVNKDFPDIVALFPEHVVYKLLKHRVEKVHIHEEGKVRQKDI